MWERGSFRSSYIPCWSHWNLKFSSSLCVGVSARDNSGENYGEDEIGKMLESDGMRSS